MATIKFLTWNVRGLRDGIKRTAVLKYLKAHKADVMVLVETYIAGHLQTAIKRPWIGWAYHSTYTNLSRGVTILIAKSTPFELVSTSVIGVRPAGQVPMHVNIGGTPILLLASYIPPPYRSDLVMEGLAYIVHNPKVPVVWIGDFNTTTIPH